LFALEGYVVQDLSSLNFVTQKFDQGMQRELARREIATCLWVGPTVITQGYMEKQDHKRKKAPVKQQAAEVFKEPIVAVGFGADPTVDPDGSFHGFGYHNIMNQGERELPTCEVPKFHFWLSAESQPAVMWGDERALHRG
jgi:hypothetical protein